MCVCVPIEKHVCTYKFMNVYMLIIYKNIYTLITHVCVKYTYVYIFLNLDSKILFIPCSLM